MISTSIILSTGEKKWMPMKRSGRLEAFARSVIGRVEVLDAKIASCRDHGLGRIGGHLGLDARILEHRLDDQVAARQVGIVRGRRDPAQNLGLLFLGDALALDALVQQIGGVGFALLGGLFIAVEQHHLDASLR